MKIEILGSGCKNCEELYDNVLTALDRTGLSRGAEVTKVKDIDEILKLGVYTTPGLVVDGEVISTGTLLSSQQIEEQLLARIATPSP